mgnify:CR=1 FL=1
MPDGPCGIFSGAVIDFRGRPPIFNVTMRIICLLLVLLFPASSILGSGVFYFPRVKPFTLAIGVTGGDVIIVEDRVGNEIKRVGVPSDTELWFNYREVRIDFEDHYFYVRPR